MNKIKNAHKIDKDSSDNHFAILADENGKLEIVIALIVQRIVKVRSNKLLLVDYGDNSELLSNICARFKQQWHDRPYCPGEILVQQVNSKSLSEVKSVVSGCSRNDIVIFLNFTNTLSAQTQHGILTTKRGLSIMDPENWTGG